MLSDYYLGLNAGSAAFPAFTAFIKNFNNVCGIELIKQKDFLGVKDNKLTLYFFINT